MSRSHSSFLFRLALLLLLSACSAASKQPAGMPNQRAQQELPHAVLASLQKQQLPSESLSLVAFALNPTSEKAKAGLFFQAEQPRQPASTFKLLTSLAAIELLGLEYRAKVELRSFEAPKAKMASPLVLKGLGASHFSYTQAWGLLKQAQQAGIEYVPELWLDRSWLSPMRQDLSSAHFDEQPTSYYNLIPDALFLERAMTQLRFTSTKHLLTATLTQALPTLRITHRVDLNEHECKAWHHSHLSYQLKREPNGLHLHIEGDFPTHCERQHRLQLVDRATQSRLWLEEAWLTLSKQPSLLVKERHLVDKSPSFAFAHNDALPLEAPFLIASYEDPPLALTLREINKTSDNALTRQLFLALSNKRSANHQASSEAALRAWLSQLPLALEPTKQQALLSTLIVENGSGLSRKEQLSPLLLAKLLEHAYHAPYAPEFMSSLPLAGVDGTLRYRFLDVGLKGQARLKTGTLRNVVALAGYVNVPKQGDWVLVAIINHPNASHKGKVVLDTIVSELVKAADFVN